MSPCNASYGHRLIQVDAAGDYLTVRTTYGTFEFAVVSTPNATARTEDIATRLNQLIKAGETADLPGML